MDSVYAHTSNVGRLCMDSVYAHTSNVGLHSTGNQLDLYGVLLLPLSGFIGDSILLSHTESLNP